MSSMTATAILGLNNRKCPMISAGTMTPELLHHFEHHAQGYLQNKDGLKPKNFIDHIIYSFEDPLFSDWYQSQQDLLSILIFADFMVKVCTHWLPKHWQQDLVLHPTQGTPRNSTGSEILDPLRSSD